MDSPEGQGLIHSLNAVVSFLHSEGFFAAGERCAPASSGKGCTKDGPGATV